MKPLTKQDWELLNKKAWDAICNWYKPININTIYKHIDLNQLISFFLWDKVSRSIRINNDLIDSKLEKKIIASTIINISSLESEISEKWEGYKIFIKQQIYKVTSIFLLKKKKIFFPHYQNRIIKNVCLNLKKEKSLKIVGRGPFPSEIKIQRIERQVAQIGNLKKNAKSIVKAIKKGLAKCAIILIDHDLMVLQKQIEILLAQFEIADREINHLKPNLIFLYADNHFPYIAYALAAKKYKVPTFVVQHGLDCEKFYLDKTFASHLAIWGINRKNRFINAGNAESKFYVTGNPDYDNIKITKEIKLKGNYILWTTRPHSPEKCYSVSRSPQEGLDILDACLVFLSNHPHEKLVIKPHPMAFSYLFEEIIKKSTLRERISISNKNISSLIKDAKIVLTEDSTSGLDAMFYGKPIVHVHFAPSQPLIPFVQYNAALQAFTPQELSESIDKILQKRIDFAELKKNQDKFIKDFAGPMDGKATERVIQAIKEIIA